MNKYIVINKSSNPDDAWPPNYVLTNYNFLESRALEICYKHEAVKRPSYDSCHCPQILQSVTNVEKSSVKSEILLITEF